MVIKARGITAAISIVGIFIYFKNRFTRRLALVRTVLWTRTISNHDKLVVGVVLIRRLNGNSLTSRQFIGHMISRAGLGT